jgi:hypothetical protein
MLIRPSQACSEKNLDWVEHYKVEAQPRSALTRIQKRKEENCEPQLSLSDLVEPTLRVGWENLGGRETFSSLNGSAIVVCEHGGWLLGVPGKYSVMLKCDSMSHDLYHIKWDIIYPFWFVFFT